MNTNHTPGPWNRKSIPGHLFEIQDGAGNALMKIRGGMMPTLADAKLIAAAPELLCMLERVMAEICMTEEGMKHVALLTLEQARAAITKAK